MRAEMTMERWTRWSGGFWMLVEGSRRAPRRSACPVAPALGQLPLSIPSRHTENGVMKQCSEDWVSLLLCHICSVPAKEPARDTSTAKTVRDLRLTVEALTRREDKEPNSCFLETFWPIKSSYKAENVHNTFILILSCGFDFIWIGFTKLNLPGECVGLFHFWTLGLETQHFLPFLSFCPLPLIPFIFSLSRLNFPPTSPPVAFKHSFSHCPFSFSNSPLSSLLYLSVTQGQRHEESLGFPSEEEWIPRKQPSQQARQIYEVSQVSGHFLTVCARLFSGSHHSWRRTGLGSQTCGQYRWECACDVWHN